MRARLLTIVVVLLAAATAFADGLVMPGVAVLKPARTPDQRALVRFDGTTETLVIETTVQGDGRDFAWIVPLPAAPTIEASTTGLFPTLSLACAPEVIDETADAKRGAGFGWTLVALMGVGVWATVRFRRVLPIVVAFVLLPVVGLLSFPGCGAKSAAEMVPTSSVTVLARAQVGVFDTATLDVKAPAALRAWLDANGFRAPDGIDDVVAEYVKAGWVFVASKIRADADAEAVRRVHPLAFTFASKDAVYPMRLTGVGNDSVALELYVAGDRRAEIDGLVVDCCDDMSMNWLSSNDPTRAAGVGHYVYQADRGEAWRRCVGAQAITKLTGVLDRAAMARDLVVRWTEFEPKRTTYVTDGVAWRRARLPGAWAFAGVLLCGALVVRRRGTSRRPGPRDIAWFVAALLVAALTTGAAWAAAPRLPDGSKVVAHGPDDPRRLMNDLPRPPDSTFGDADAVRAWARSELRGGVNRYTGEPIREEDSPGNWQVRKRDGLVEFVVVGPSFSSLVMNVSRLARVEGTVLTADGRPVAGAAVWLTEIEWTPAPGQFFAGTIKTVADERGRYRLEAPIGRTWHVSVVRVGRPYLLRRGFDLRDAPALPLDLVLPRERTIRGRALDAAGRPVVGAKIHACRRSPFVAAIDDDLATTAADGTFEFGGFDAEAPEIQAWVAVEQPKGLYHGEVLTIRPGDPPLELKIRGD